MWTSLFQSDSRDGSTEPNFKLILRARRRRRRVIAGAELLESRAMLSASGTELPSEKFSVIDLQDALPPIPAEISSASDFEQDLAAEVDLETSRHSSVSSDRIDGTFASLGGSGFPELSSIASDGRFASASGNSSAQRGSSLDRVSSTESFFSSLSKPAVSTVELQIAETGQVVSVVAGTSIQGSHGLTVIDDHSPTTYLQSTDSEGRTQSRLVFVSRAARLVPDSQPVAADEADGVIVADAESFDRNLSNEELAARPDLHDFETALNSATVESSETSPSSLPKDATMNLAATIRTRWIATKQSTTAIAPQGDAGKSAVGDAQVHRTEQPVHTTDEFDAGETTAFPIFDPTTRNVVLSVCFIGSLARATARRRRRQKAAFAS